MVHHHLKICSSMASQANRMQFPSMPHLQTEASLPGPGAHLSLRTLQRRGEEDLRLSKAHGVEVKQSRGG